MGDWLVHLCVRACVYMCVGMLAEQQVQGPAGRFDHDFLEASDAKEPWFLVVNTPWQGEGSQEGIGER